MKISRFAMLAVLVLVSIAAASLQAGLTRSYLDRLERHEVRLEWTEPAPQEYENTPPPSGVDLVTYPSGDLTLKAWLAMPPEAEDGTVPGVVYLHGGFAFAESDFQDAVAFLDSGFALMTPMLRGENGNPGHYELFLGEVDDAAAAVRWLAENPRVDPDHIYVFGHSVGGALSALLTLREDVPFVDTGSCGGLYQDDLFSGWSDIVPFDYSDKEERDLRLLLGNQRWMQKSHFAYVGKGDNGKYVRKAAEQEMKKSDSLLQVKVVSGDHWTSLPTSIELYLEHIGKTMK